MSRQLHVITQPHHLAARFFTSLSSKPPDPSDEEWALSHLLDGEQLLWRRMTNQDRRHSAAVGRRFVTERPEATRAEIAGALLHDVGKLECGLGTWGRAIATLVGGRTDRFRRYHDHEHIGSLLAQQAGSEPDTVDLIAERGPAYPTLSECDHA